MRRRERRAGTRRGAATIVAALSLAAVGLAAQRDVWAFDPQPHDPRRVNASDRIALPPAERTSVSRDGRFVFVVSAVASGWRTPAATAALYTIEAGARRMLWTHALAQQYGPRFALVSDAGTVVMLDEWINVSTPFAVMIVDREGRTVAQRSTDEVRAALDVPMSELARRARFGWWLSGAPTLSDDGDIVRAPSAGRVLLVRVSDGKLSSSDR